MTLDNLFSCDHFSFGILRQRYVQVTYVQMKENHQIKIFIIWILENHHSLSIWYENLQLFHIKNLFHRLKMHFKLWMNCVSAGQEANCVVCDRPGEIAEQLFCTSCGQHYHGNCLDPPVEVNPIVRAGWQCPECKICQTCR